MTSSIHHALGTPPVLLTNCLVTMAKATLLPASLPSRITLAKNRFPPDPPCGGSALAPHCLLNQETNSTIRQQVPAPSALPTTSSFTPSSPGLCLSKLGPKPPRSSRELTRGEYLMPHSESSGIDTLGQGWGTPITCFNQPTGEPDGAHSSHHTDPPQTGVHGTKFTPFRLSPLFLLSPLHVTPSLSCLPKQTPSPRPCTPCCS